MGISILTLCLATVIVCGCIQQQTPPITPTQVTTPVPGQTITAVPATPAPVIMYNESASLGNVPVPLGSHFIVTLLENPTTGYPWNVTVTDGLVITGDTFTPPQSGLPGAGGNRTWDVLTTNKGPQMFSGVYKQPWTNSSVNDSTFNLGVTVT